MDNQIRQNWGATPNLAPTERLIDHSLVHRREMTSKNFAFEGFKRLAVLLATSVRGSENLRGLHQDFNHLSVSTTQKIVFEFTQFLDISI